MKIPMPGRCQCGAISYTLNNEPLFGYACHCYNCQKRTGSAFSMGLVITLDSLELEGELVEWSRISDEGNTNTRHSCASCGNIIYGTADNSPGLAKLQTGTLADTSDVEPEVHIWTRSKQPWVTLPAGAPAYETQPGDSTDMLQAALDYRAAR